MLFKVLIKAEVTIPQTYTIETVRCRLLCFSLEDIPYVFSATRYEGFNDGMLWEPPEREEELVEPHKNSLEAWKDGRAYGFTIKSKAHKDFIGRISLRKEKEEGVWNIGFWTHPIYQGQGYMSECALAVIDFGFIELKAQRIEAYYALWNKASERVLMKIGMSFIEHLPHGFLKKGRWIEENRLGISRQGWHLLQTSLNQPDGCNAPNS